MPPTSGPDKVVLDSGGDDVTGLYLSIMPRKVIVAGRVDMSSTLQDDIDLSYHRIGIKDMTTNLTGGYLVFRNSLITVGTAPGLEDIGRARQNALVANFVTTAWVDISQIAPADLPLADGQYVTLYEIFEPYAFPPRAVPIFGDPDHPELATDYTEYHDYSQLYSDQTVKWNPKVNIVEGRRDDDLGWRFVKQAAWEDSPGLGYRDIYVTGLATVSFTGSTPFAWVWVLNDCTILDGGAVTDRDLHIRVPVGARYIYLFLAEVDGGVNQTCIALFTHNKTTYKPLTNFQVTRNRTNTWKEVELTFFGNALESDETVIPKFAPAVFWEDPPHFKGGSLSRDSGYRDQTFGWMAEGTTLLKTSGNDRFIVTLAGTGYWADKFGGTQQTLTNTGDTPHKWYNTSTMYIDHVIHYTLESYCNLLDLVNAFFTGVTNPGITLDIPDGSIWSQVGAEAKWALVSTCMSDSLGTLWFRRNIAYLEDDERALRPPVLNLLPAQWTGAQGLQLQEVWINPIASVDAGGIRPTDAVITTSSKPIIYGSRAPGRRSGGGLQKTNLTGQWLPLDTPQRTLDRLVGHHYAYLRNPFPNVPVNLSGNYDIVEPALNEPVSLTWLKATIRGLVLVQSLFIVKEINITHRKTPGEAAKSIAWTVEMLTRGNPGQEIPQLQIDDIDQPDDVIPPEPVMILSRGTRAIGGITDGRKLYFIYDIDTGSPTTVSFDLSGSIPNNLSSVAVSPFSPYYLGTGSSIDVFLQTVIGDIYKIADVLGARTVTHQFTAASGSNGNYIQYERAEEGYILASGEGAELGGEMRFVLSLDGVTWAAQADSGLHGSWVSGMADNFYMSPHSHLVYVFPRGSGNIPFRSTDQGVTFAPDSTQDIGPSSIGIHVPFQDTTDKINYTVSTSSGLVRSSGTSRTFLSPPFLPSALGVKTYDLDKAILVVVGHGDGAALSNDEGATWTLYPYDAPSLNPDRLWIAGDDPSTWYVTGLNFFAWKAQTDSVIRVKGVISGNLLNIFGIPNTP